jgi:hypothetical protein
MPIWGTGLNPAPPEGYDYDYVNKDVLVNMMKVSPDGRISLPGGMNYAVLVLPNTDKMSLPVIEKLTELVKNGATIIGPRPAHTPGFTGYPGSEEKLRSAASELWGDLNGVSRTRRSYGKGKVVWGTPVENVLRMNGIEPDLEYGRPLGATLNWIHRKTDDAEIYLIVNSTDKPLNTEVSCRQQGLNAELWDPATGEIRSAASSASGVRTIVPVSLAERQSAYLVFRKNEINRINTGNWNSPSLSVILNGTWDVSFQPGLGASDMIKMDTLKSWTMNKDEGVKYYSGTATYSISYKAGKELIQNAWKIVLDLGKVGDMAEVSVNDVAAGLVWKAPWQIDITGSLKTGTNRIVIRVTNEWTNRLAGDRATKTKILNSPLFVRPGFLTESGLMGPVRILKYTGQKTN